MTYTEEFYSFDDYRKLLSWIVEQRRELGKTFSYRWFSQKAGLQSPNFLQLVTSGQRHLSSTLAVKTAQILGFNKSEREFFLHLVDFNKAKSIEGKVSAATSLRKIKEFKQVLLQDSCLFDYYSDPAHIVVRELCTVRPATLAEIEQALIPRVEKNKLLATLERLITMGLLRQNPDETYQAQEGHLTTKNRVAKAAIYTFHHEMIARGAQSMDTFSASEREVSCVTTKLSKESFEKVREKIIALKEEILFLSQQDAEAAQVYQVNFQAFPLTKPLSARKK